MFKKFRIAILFFCLLFQLFSFSQPIRKTNETIYLFPGQGSDSNIFKTLTLKKNYQIRIINYPIPPKRCSMASYAKLISSQIDTSEQFVLIGVSLGGMICTELADLLHPEKVIIVSSAKCRSELPFKYRFQHYLPINKIVPKGMIKWAALKIQPIVEPDSKNMSVVFRGMLNRKDKKFLKRSINMIVNWKRKSYSSKIIHIHGNKDYTIPIKNIKSTNTISNGSHMMMLTKGAEISEIISKELGE